MFFRDLACVSGPAGMGCSAAAAARADGRSTRTSLLTSACIGTGPVSHVAACRLANFGCGRCSLRMSLPTVIGPLW